MIMMKFIVHKLADMYISSQFLLHLLECSSQLSQTLKLTSTEPMESESRLLIKLRSFCVFLQHFSASTLALPWMLNLDEPSFPSSVTCDFVHCKINCVT